MAKVNITVEGEEKLVARLQKMGSVSSIQKGLKQAAYYVLGQAALTIKRHGNGTWAPYRVPPKDGHQLLLDKGGLIGSLAPNSNNNVLDIEDTTATIGSSLRYAAPQQEGVPSRNIPARPFLTFSGDIPKNVSAIIGKYVVSNE